MSDIPPIDLRSALVELFDHPPAQYEQVHRETFEAFIEQLNAGTARAAEPDANEQTGWRANAWVKKGILVGFRMGAIADMTGAGPLRFFDKATYPLRPVDLEAKVRIVPGGSSIRTGCYLGRGVTCMPPMYINVGAWVGDNTMVDSHALVGSCAQIGSNVHLSAAAQIGGVLEPVGALPVIIEDNVLVGGNCGVYEGTVVKQGAVLGSGCVLNRSTPVYDLVRRERYVGTVEQPLVIPENAVVIPGSRRITQGIGAEWGLSLYTPVIVKYRDQGTDTRVQLEALLR